MKRELVCTVCPRGCRLTADDETLAVSGNFCPRGEEYGKAEVTDPKRTVTGTVAIKGGIHSRLPVRTAAPVSKSKMQDVMKELHSFTAVSPVKRGEVLIKNAAETGVDVIASRDM